MCGLTGAMAFSAKGQAALALIENANNCIIKRGPDGGSVYQHQHVALGHRRLSIIDTTQAGDQPMHSRDGRFTIVFNGEIFNYRTLSKAYLTSEEQQSLRSHSDTEVFLVMFAKMGTAVFELLEGFFAAAIYDHLTASLVLVRDRYGKKPLLIYQDADRVVFASEMKALFAAGIPRELAWNMLPVYLQLNYIPQPHSLVKGVRKLSPGHYLQISKEGEVRESPYYELKIREKEYTNYSYSEAQKKLEELMDNAVAKRLIADVPLGAFLSGCIDSSVVVALASRHTQKLNTFSIGYKDNAFFDETAYARMVAEKYGTEHTVFMLGNNDFLEHISNVLEYIDEPFADSSAIPVYILSHHTRKHVTVALSGDGGDEVFAGYNKHAAEWRMRQGGLLNSAVKWGGPLWAALPQSRNHPLTNKFRQLHRFARGASISAGDRYWQWASFLNSPQSMDLLHARVQSKVAKPVLPGIEKKFTAGIKGADFNEVLLADMNLVLLSDMLVKVDSMSMANSLEIRSPFLDHHVVDFAFGLPEAYKIDGKMKKRIVQDAFRHLLPDAIYNRPKHGFEIPLLDWFRKDLWGLINDDLLSDKFVAEQEVLNLGAVQELKKRLHSNNPGDSHATIWALLVFQHWWKRYMV
jgi:asparagine synthase (glutamine-hydrolysing)